MQIAVTTPTGHVGQHVVSLLVRAGLRPRVLVRDPARLAPDLRELVDAVAVDLSERESVLAATRDVDSLYWVDPTPRGDDPLTEYARYSDVVAQAVSTNRIGRTVFQSSVGAEKRHGAGEIDGLARTEEALDATGAAVLHLRCGFFFSNLLAQLDALRSGVVSVVLPTDQPMAWVAPRDVAEVAVTRLLGPAWTGRRVQAVHGPADLSWDEAAAAISGAIGRSVRVERIPDEQLHEILTGTGLSSSAAEAILAMSTGLRSDFTPEQPRDATTTTPTALGGWCFDELRPRL